MATGMFEGVTATLAAYGQLLEDEDFTRWMDLFTPDAVFVIRGTRYAGRAGLEQFLKDRPSGPRKHIYGLAAILPDGDDGATATGSFIAVRPAEGGARVSSVGVCRDRLRRDGDRWRFVERIVTPAPGFEASGPRP